MPDRTTRADTSVKKDHTEEMPQAEATLRAENQQPMDEPKVLETVTKRDIMEKLYLMMKQFDQSFQALNKQMELQTLRTIESLSPATRTQLKEEFLEETSKEAVLHEYDVRLDDKTNVYDHDEVSEDDTDKEDDLQEVTEETFANKYDTDRNDEDEIAWNIDEAIENGADKDQNDENAFFPIMISQSLSGDKFQNDSDSKNV